MIADGMYGIIFTLLDKILALLPDVSWSVDSGAMSYFISMLQVVFYLLPMDTVVQIVGIVITITVFRILVALVRTVWAVLPIV